MESVPGPIVESALSHESIGPGETPPGPDKHRANVQLQPLVPPPEIIPGITVPLSFFLIGSLFLLIRPLSHWMPGAVFEVPEIWEPMVLGILTGTTFLLRPSLMLFLVLVGWASMSTGLSQAFPVPWGIRAVCLLALVERFDRESAPFFWCILWLGLPSSFPAIFGELVSRELEMGLAFVCWYFAYRTSVSKWQTHGTSFTSYHLATGLGIGLFFGVAIPEALPVVPSKAPPIHVLGGAPLGAHETGAVGAGETYSELFQVLGEAGFQVEFGDLATWNAPDGAVSGISSRTIVLSLPSSAPLNGTVHRGLLTHISGGGGFLGILKPEQIGKGDESIAGLLASLGLSSQAVSPGSGSRIVGKPRFSAILGSERGIPESGGSISPCRSWLPFFLSPDGPHPLIWSFSDSTPEPGGFPANWNGAWGRLGKGYWAILVGTDWFRDGKVVTNLDFLGRILGLIDRGFRPRNGFFVFLAVSILIMGVMRLYRTVGKPFFPLGILFGSILASFILDHVREKVPDLFGRKVAAFLEVPFSRHRLSPMVSDGSSIDIDLLAGSLFQAGFSLRTFDPERDAPISPHLWILPPCDRVPDQALLERMRSQVAEGSTLLLIGSHRMRGAVETFRRLGFRLEAISENQFPCEQDSRGLPRRVMEGPFEVVPLAHPLLGSWSQSLWSRFPVPVSGGEALLSRDDGTPVLTLRTLEKGWLLACGDDSFFSARGQGSPGEERQMAARGAFLENLFRVAGREGRP